MGLIVPFHFISTLTSTLVTLHIHVNSFANIMIGFFLKSLGKCASKRCCKESNKFRQFFHKSSNYTQILMRFFLEGAVDVRVGKDNFGPARRLPTRPGNGIGVGGVGKVDGGCFALALSLCLRALPMKVFG